jgi:hypothetical protein
VVADTVERLSVSKRATQEFDVGRFVLKEPNYVFLCLFYGVILSDHKVSVVRMTDE